MICPVCGRDGLKQIRHKICRDPRGYGPEAALLLGCMDCDSLFESYRDCTPNELEDLEDPNDPILSGVRTSDDRQIRIHDAAPDRIIEGIRWNCGCGFGFFEFRTIRKMEVI